MGVNTRDQYTLYFIKPIGLDGPVKIGLSADPERRLREFNSWSPFELEIVGSVPGNWSDEQFLHECLGDHHSHGEWFHAKPLVVETIQSVLATGSVAIARASLRPVMNVRSKKNRETRATKPRMPKYPRARAEVRA